MVLYDIVWHGMIWYGMVWYGLLCYSNSRAMCMVFLGLLHDTRTGIIFYDVMWYMI